MIRSIIIIVSLLLLGGCGFKKLRPHKPADNPPPVVRVDFEDMDVNKDQVIDRVEYISEVSTVHHDESLIAFICITGVVLLIVVILAATMKKL